MEIITKSAEHHFLTTIQKLKAAPDHWAGLHFSLSKKLGHDEILKQPSAINKTLKVAKSDAELTFEKIKDNADCARKGILYFFDDNDIILLVPCKGEEQTAKVQKLFKMIAAELDDNLSEFSMLKNEIYAYQKLADQKLLSARAVEAYKAMADKHKIGSITTRRERRDFSLVQVIEDDRFTASYTANILNREYDMILSRNGEDGILQYIENAPDIVLIDIHLPRLSGHQVLASLKAVDPNVYAVMLSVDTVKDNIVKSAESGANNFLKKPFSKERLIHIVKNSPFVQGSMRRNAVSSSTH